MKRLLMLGLIILMAGLVSSDNTIYGDLADTTATTTTLPTESYCGATEIEGCWNNLINTIKNFQQEIGTWPNRLIDGVFTAIGDATESRLLDYGIDLATYKGIIGTFNDILSAIWLFLIMDTIVIIMFILAIILFPQLLFIMYAFGKYKGIDALGAYLNYNKQLVGFFLNVIGWIVSKIVDLVPL